jgi:hypothetical protein
MVIEEDVGMDKEKYLAETRILDYAHPAIEQLVKERQWEELPE